MTDTDGSIITLSAENGDSAGLGIQNGTGAIGFLSLGPEPILVLRDSQNFQAHLGVTDTETTRTGESHKTSAASLVFFDKDGKVIGKSP